MHLEVETAALFFTLGAIALVGFVVWSIRSESCAKEKKVQETFADRESLIRKILEEQLDADMSRLRAEDDFSKNLSFFWDFDSMANVEIVLAIEKHFQIKIADPEAEKIHTVSELVRLVSNKVGRPHEL